MADLDRMTIEEVPGKVLAEEHGHWLRDAVSFLAGAREVARRPPSPRGVGCSGVQRSHEQAAAR
jgi:hypothetical protein